MGTYNLKFIFYNFDKSLQFTTIQNLFRFYYIIAPYTFYNSAYSDITFDLLRTKYKETVISGSDTSKAGTITNQMNSIIGFTLVHDNTNDVFSPTRGTYHSITLENAGLLPRFFSLLVSNLSYSQYFKLYVLNKIYHDITGGRATQIVAGQIKLGDIMEYGKGDRVVPVAPIYKFFSGGSSSVRGWNAKEGGILASPETGGTFLFEGSLEFRWKTFATNQNLFKNIWTVYFVDFGNVWEKDKNFRFDQIALAAGLGLRYDTFIGPLRLDLGFKLYDPNAEQNKKWLFKDLHNTFKDHKFAVQFGIGNAF
jgi:outer membrane protein insertion porin family